METIICDNDSELVSAITEFLDVIASRKISNKDDFSLGLSGGSIVEILCKVLMNLSETIYKHIHFFFCDERYVNDSNSLDFIFNLYNDTLFSKRHTANENIHKINLSLNLSDSTVDYKSNIQNYFKINSTSSNKIPKFDVLFLGVGPDGHTASLFPNHKLLKDTDRLIACLDDSPKAPSCRITMTLPLINSAHNICVIAVGESKASIVEECLNDFKCGGNENYPVSLVNPYHGHLIWFLNTDSARFCNEYKGSRSDK